jgi:single-strand selective monofunctional uracil DNA glycosylase
VGSTDGGGGTSRRVVRSGGAAAVAAELARRAGRLSFGPPVAHVYNPLEYAWHVHEQYLERFARPGCEVLLVGMNPGPWGMVQTGVPFGEVGLVRDWLRIEGSVAGPARQHRKRPIQGFACPRSEVSGRRLWGWARDRFGTPEAFFARFFVWNWCPLAFMEEGGRNVTPDQLARHERAELFAVCDDALREVALRLRPRLVVGIGKFAAGRAAVALAESGVRIGSIPHPSPASPAANRGWDRQVDARLRELGIDCPPPG